MRDAREKARSTWDRWTDAAEARQRVTVVQSARAAAAQVVKRVAASRESSEQMKRERSLLAQLRAFEIDQTEPIDSDLREILGMKGARS